jgi:hypothetical protein
MMYIKPAVAHTGLINSAIANIWVITLRKGGQRD